MLHSTFYTYILYLYWILYCTPSSVTCSHFVCLQQLLSVAHGCKRRESVPFRVSISSSFSSASASVNTTTALDVLHADRKHDSRVLLDVAPTLLVLWRSPIEIYRRSPRRPVMCPTSDWVVQNTTSTPCLWLSSTPVHRWQQGACCMKPIYILYYLISSIHNYRLLACYLTVPQFEILFLRRETAVCTPCTCAVCVSWFLRAPLIIAARRVPGWCQPSCVGMTNLDLPCTLPRTRAFFRSARRGYWGGWGAYACSVGGVPDPFPTLHH